MVEGEVDLVLNVGTECASSINMSPQRIRLAVPTDIPALRAAAARVFTASRFRAPWYDVQDSGRFYAAWIEKAVLGTFD
ncbi:hypothetical protein Q0O39_13815, partial [Staphylococcus aureus]|nr:hypothetical protein [Staphylococcus aureus]